MVFALIPVFSNVELYSSRNLFKILRPIILSLGLRNSFQEDQSRCFDFKNEKSMNPQVDDKNTKI